MRNPLIAPEGFYWSASRIKNFQECEKCFYLKYVLKVPAPYEDDTPFRYGSAVHNTIENLSQGKEELYEKDYFDSEESYESYMKHIELARGAGSPLLQEGDYLLSELEFVYWNKEVSEHPFYGFLDGVIFDEKFKFECLRVGFVPKAVQMQDGMLHWYGLNDGNELMVLISEPGYFGASKVKKMIEMKTQANKWSYNSIKTSIQFIIYSLVKNEFFGEDILFQLVNFYRKPKPSIQKERLQLDGKQVEILKTQVGLIDKAIKNNARNQISTCSHFSPYKDICENFTF